jgi:hypothetical protein
MPDSTPPDVACALPNHARATELPPLAASALRTLLYYGLFRFPLRLVELQHLCDVPCPDAQALARTLDALERDGLVGRHADHVFVGDPAQVDERRAGEARARRLHARVRRRARLIGRFPFVRAVALSGTLSKGVLGLDDDVDFFVITTPGRLWLCRALLMGFKKTVLFNSHRLFCVNYLVDEQQLAIPERNRFTATEIAWLRPLVGPGPARAFFDANPWVSEFLPNWRRADDAPGEALPPGRLKRAFEHLLAGPFGAHLNERCRALIARHNERRYRDLAPADFVVALRTAAGASKHHPRHYQRRILERFDASLAEFEQQHGVRLRPTPITA